MKSFDPNYIYRFSKKTIKLTFQQWEYRGIAFVEIGGNCTFVDMLLYRNTVKQQMILDYGCVKRLTIITT